MSWQIAEDFARANVLLQLPGHAPMPAFRVSYWATHHNNPCLTPTS